MLDIANKMQRLVLTLFLYKIFQSYRIFTNNIFPEFIVKVQNHYDRKYNYSECEKNDILQYILIQ